MKNGISFNRLSQLVDWWLEGLLYLLPDSLHAWLKPSSKRINLIYKDNQVLAQWPDQPEPTSYDIFSNLEGKELKHKLSQLKAEKEDTVLIMSARYGLSKNLRLPAAAEAELDTILKFEVDRQTPFSADQVYSGYAITNKNKAENSLNLQLNVIPRKVLDPIIEGLSQLNISLNKVELEQSNNLSINLLPETQETKSTGLLKTINMCLFVLVLGLIALNVALPFLQVKNAIEQTDERTQNARKDAMEVSQFRTQWEADNERRDSLKNKIQIRLTSAELLDELTRLIPDDTYLTRLQIRDETLNVQGESSSATQLISLIDASTLFSNTRFQSPVTTNISTGKERFQISTKINPDQEQNK